MHPEFGIDEHIECVGADRRGDVGHAPLGTDQMTKPVDTAGDLAPYVVLPRMQVISEDFESRPIESGDPAPEIHADGTHLEERRREADTDAPTCHRRSRNRPTELGRSDVDRARDECRVLLLKRPVVLALVGEQEIAPLPRVEDLGRRLTGRAALHDLAERGETIGIGESRRCNLVSAGIEHRQRQMQPERGAQVLRIRLDGPFECRARLPRVAAFGEHDPQLEPLGRGGLEFQRTQIELRRFVETALPLQQAGQADQRGAQIGTQPQGRTQGGLGGPVVPQIALQEPERRMAERIVRLQTERIADHDDRVGEAPSGTQRRAEIVQRADILRPQPNSLLETHDGGVVVAGIGQEQSEKIVGLRIIRTQPCGAAQARDCCGQLPGVLLCQCQLVMRGWRRSGRPPLRPAPGQATRQASPASAAASASGQRSRIAAR